MTRHNGFANYSTWRVKTDVFKDFDLDDWCLDMLDSVELAGWMKDHVSEIIEEAAQPGLARDFAMAFIADVNWQELAQTARDEYLQGDLEV
jgi:hypothetical protein